MDRDDGDVTRPLRSAYVPPDALCRMRRQVSEDIHACATLPGRPVGRHARARHPTGEHEHASPVRHVDRRRRRGLHLVAAGARGADALCAQHVQCLRKSTISPIEDMVVREHAAIDLRRNETGRVGRMHAIVNVLSRPRLVGRGDRGLEIDDPRIGANPRDLGERIAPDVAEIDRSPDGPVRLLGDLDVVEGRALDALVEVRLARMGEDLIHAAAGHHVAAEQQGHVLPHGSGRSRKQATGQGPAGVRHEAATLHGSSYCMGVERSST